MLVKIEEIFGEDREAWVQAMQWAKKKLGEGVTIENAMEKERDE